MTIYVIHGLVQGFRANSFAHLNMLDRADLSRFLTSKCDDGQQFVSLEDALVSNSADALTVDDSTRAAFEACLLSRQLGHDVTWFINPRNIRDATVYFFARLNSALDMATCERVFWRGVEFRTDSFTSRRIFRKAVKKAFRARSSEEELDEVVDEAIHSLQLLNNFAVAEHLRTITTHDIRAAKAAGVRIGNHGWTHIEIANLTPSELRHHVAAGAEWIVSNTDEKGKWYAVPFGQTPIPDECEDLVGGPWFLEDGADGRRRIGKRGWNRLPLKPASIGRNV